MDLSTLFELIKLAKEEKPGLWANIRAKRKRGEPAAKPGDKDYPDKEQWKELTKEATLTTMDNTLALLGIEKLASSPAWQRSEGKNREGGLNAKGRASYNRATGGNLKAPVTESNPKGKRAKRRKSFCGRMCGMKRVNTGAKAKRDPDSRINKSLRKWNCKCGAGDFDLFELAELIKEAKAMKNKKRCWDGYKPVKGKKPYSEDSCEKV